MVLDALRNLIPNNWQLKTVHSDLASLSEWAVEARYPGEWQEPTIIDASEAVEQARTVWTSVSKEMAQQRGV